MRRARAARGRHRAVRRPDAAEARRTASSEAGVPILGTSRRRDRPGRGPRALRRPARAARATRRRRTRPRTRSRRRSTKGDEVGYPLLVRPSYVLGGRAMEIVYDRDGPGRLPRAARRRRPTATARAARSSSTASWRTRSRSTSTRCATASRSGSAGCSSTSRRPASTRATAPRCCRRTRSGPEMLAELRAQTEGIALGLGVVGLINVQYAIHGGRVYVIEANPRASRTVPFISKAVGVPLAKLAVPADARREDRRPGPARGPDGAATTSRSRRRSCRSTASRTPTRCSAPRCARPARSWASPATSRRRSPRRRPPRARRCRRSGTVFLTVTDSDKAGGPRRSPSTLHDLGFQIVATRGTAQAIRAMGVPVRGDQQDRRGRQQRRRLDRARRRRPRRQHADRLGRALGRLGDPPRGGRRRRAVHHDDLRRRRRRPRDRGRAAARARRGALAPGDPRRGSAAPAPRASGAPAADLAARSSALLFRLDPERAHHLVFALLRARAARGCSRPRARAGPARCAPRRSA